MTEVGQEVRQTIFQEKLAAAKPFFVELLTQLRDPLKVGAYTSILGDDVSGRIPTLVIGDVAAHYAAESGKTKPLQVFYAGGSPQTGSIFDILKISVLLDKGPPTYGESGLRTTKGATEEQIAEHIQQGRDDYIGSIKERLGTRTLVVIDQLNRGRSVDAAARSLHKQGIGFDVATLGNVDPMNVYIETRKDRPEFAGTRWFSGGDTSQNGGVLYSRNDDLWGSEIRPLIGTEKKFASPVTQRAPNFAGAEVAESRQFLSQYSADLYAQTKG